MNTFILFQLNRLIVICISKMATVTKKRKRAVPILQFEDLPAEIDIKVMSYLDITGLIKFTRVSKKIRALGQGPLKKWTEHSQELHFLKIHK